MNSIILLVFLAKSLTSYEFIEAQYLKEEDSVSSVTDLARRLEDSNVFALQIQRIRTTSEAAAPAGNDLNGEAANVHTESEKRPGLEDYVPYRNENVGIGENKIESDNGIAYVENALRVEPARKLVRYGCLNDAVLSENYENDNGQETMHDNLKKVYSYYKVGINKRDAMNKNISTIKKTPLKQNNKEKINMTEVKQFKTESDKILFRENVPIMPITTKIFEIVTNELNVNIDLELTEIPGNTKDIWYGEQDKSHIRFSELPQKETYMIPTLKLEEGFYPFQFMTEFFKLIYPFDFPIELIKDIVWGKFTFPYSFIQSIKVESTFLVSIIIFVFLSLVIPAYLFCLALMALLARTDAGEVDAETGALFPGESRPDCKARLNLLIMSFVILFCCGCIAGMTVSNEQAWEAVAASRAAARCACADLGRWVTAAARDLHDSLVPPIDLVTEAYREDLKNVVELLGEPVQKAISSESGIDLVLDSLNDITSESQDLSVKISALRDASVSGRTLATAVADRLKDLARQLDNLKKYCSGKNMALCDTLNTHSLDLLVHFDMILHEHNLLELRFLGVDNLTSAIASARREFTSLPSVITKQTASVRADVLQDIEKRRIEIHKLCRVLSDIVRHLTADLRTASGRFESVLLRLERYDNWRWSIMLGCNIMCSVVMLLVISGLSCGCGDAKKHAMRTLKVSSIWILFVSLILWTLIAATYLIAGHAEVYVCHALWDGPGYHTLSSLLDRPSPLSPQQDGIFDAIFKELENVTVDISISEVLRDCEKDQPAYDVFQLEKILDVNKATSYFEWEELQGDLNRMRSVLDVGFLKSITSELSKILQLMQQTSNVDLARYRLEFNRALVGRDLPSLVEQMQTIAAQISDLTSSSRLETLASRTHRLHQTSIKPLEELRADIVYKMTELELQLGPFRRKLNISLSHIHTAQYYIDNQGEFIAQKRVAEYAGRLVSHLAGWRTHALAAVSEKVARCHPLFAVFSGARSLLCTRYISSLHGWWFCALILAILWCVCTPLCVWFWRNYAEIRANDALLMTNMETRQQDTPATMICDASNWNSAGSPTPQNDAW